MHLSNTSAYDKVCVIGWLEKLGPDESIREESQMCCEGGITHWIPGAEQEQLD